MTSRKPDVIVAGLGAMGAATLYQLAALGVPALGIDRFTPPHSSGSSHGESRITRQAIGEGGEYVQFVLRSNEIWRQLEEETEEKLFLKTGIAVIGPQGGGGVHHGKKDFVGRTAKVAAQHGIAHEVLSGQELGYRYPQFILGGDEEVYFEPGGGVLFPEKCIAVQLRQAAALGAQMRLEETVMGWTETADGIRIGTNKGVYEAAKLILCAGAWLPKLIPENVAAVIKVYPQILHWFPVKHATDYSADSFPAYIWMHGQNSGEHFYGFPIIGESASIKLAGEQYSDEWDGISLRHDEPFRSAQHEVYQRHVHGHLRDVMEPATKSLRCLYSVTPDSGFILDQHPESEKVWIVSACSGHGFKHSAGVGEALAKWVANETPPLDMSAFALRRFAI